MSDKSFNCYDGAYVTSYLANKHNLRYEIIHGRWEGVGHGAVRVYKNNSTYEIFDTKQMQEGYGQDGAEHEINWTYIDKECTKGSKIESTKILNKQ